MNRSLTRREFGGLALKTGVAAAFVAGVDGFAIEPHLRMVAERVDVTLSRLPAEFDGLRIAQLTDIHFGPNIGRKHVERSLHVAAAFKPDLIVLTGDFVSHPVLRRNRRQAARNAEPCADALVELKT